MTKIESNAHIVVAITYSCLMLWGHKARCYVAALLRTACLSVRFPAIAAGRSRSTAVGQSRSAEKGTPGVSLPTVDDFRCPLRIGRRPSPQNRAPVMDIDTIDSELRL
jgi:hypothetical protein